MLNIWKKSLFFFSVLSAMIRGAHDGQNIIVTDYKEEDLEAIFSSFFKPEKSSDSSWKRKRFHKQDELFKGMSAMQHQIYFLKINY